MHYMGNANSGPGAKPLPKPLTKEDLTSTRKSILDLTEPGEDGSIVLTQKVLELVDGDEDLIAYLHSVINTIPRTDNPDQISNFNYHYVDGELRNIETGKKFHWVNQVHYDALGDTIFRHIQGLMVSEYGLEEVFLPLDPDYTGPKNNIFVSPNWQSAEKLMLLIQGSGAVRPGQWARALCINDNLREGSILPYLAKCQEAGYSVIVFNPNQNYGTDEPEPVLAKDFLWPPPKTVGASAPTKQKQKKIPGNSNGGQHVIYVWDNFVAKSSAKAIGAVAHSAGGWAAQTLVDQRGEEVAQRLYGIAFTDSVHGVGPRDPDHVKHFIQKRCRNWVKSDKSLDTKIGKPMFDCLRVSAGHPKHEWTSGTSIESVFKFLFEREATFLAGEDPNDTNYDNMTSSSTEKTEEGNEAV